MDKKEVITKIRVAAVRRQLNKRKIDCLVLTKPPNVSYVTGFKGDDSWAIITGRMVYLLTDSRYTEQAQAECCRCKVVERTSPITQAAAKLVGKLKSVHTVHVEASTSLESFQALKKRTRVRLRTAAGIIEAVRTTKDKTEVMAIRSAARIADRALRLVLPRIKPGITENELAGALDFEIRKLGARNARYDGYCQDLTRCFAIGRPGPFYKKVYEAVRQAQAAAIQMVKPGVDVLQVDQAARSVIRNAGLPVYGHGTGHGLGLEIHEGPVVSKEGKGKLEAGMALTIEPGVYVPGKLGVRIEDDILVTAGGYKILSRASR
jgi:Xaa-Pro aminopeptidase